MRDLVLLDQVQESIRIEGFHDDRGSAEHRCHHVEAQGGRMVERRRRQIDRLRPHAAHIGAKHQQERIRSIDRLALEFLLDALGPSGGAG